MNNEEFVPFRQEVKNFFRRPVKNWFFRPGGVLVPTDVTAIAFLSISFFGLLVAFGVV